MLELLAVPHEVGFVLQGSDMAVMMMMMMEGGRWWRESGLVAEGECNQW